MAPFNVKKAHDELLDKIGGKGTRREMGVVRKTDFQPPKDTKSAKGKQGDEE